MKCVCLDDLNKRIASENHTSAYVRGMDIGDLNLTHYSWAKITFMFEVQMCFFVVLVSYTRRRWTIFPIISNAYPLNLVEHQRSPYLMSGSLRTAATCPDTMRHPFGINPVEQQQINKWNVSVTQQLYRAVWVEIDHIYLWISIDRIWMRIRLIAPRHTVSLNVAHHAIAGRYDRWCQCFLQLFLLLAIFGTAILKPYLFKRTELKHRSRSIK